jgi:hypothetical protein
MLLMPFDQATLKPCVGAADSLVVLGLEVRPGANANISSLSEV